MYTQEKNTDGWHFALEITFHCFAVIRSFFSMEQTYDHELCMYNASVVKIYSTTDSIASFKIKNNFS
jgi:hypothetical protein